uniref:UPAR/Ly6 domain-containing protein n=1 Tax=Maylandia zebra TaxID=106582 RepID=A0A3P9DMF4_9CICH
MTLQNQGCVSSSLCNQTEKGSLLGITYTLTRKCCTTDQCNGASSAHLPLAAALGACLAAQIKLRYIFTHHLLPVLAVFSAAGGLKLHTRGCLESDLCGASLNGSILSVAYSTSFQCCNTDVCNGATSIQLPLTVALFAALLASLWMWLLSLVF